MSDTRVIYHTAGKKKVITYQSALNSFSLLDICPACDQQLRAADDERVAEYCQVSHGLHRGRCEICQPVDQDGQE